MENTMEEKGSKKWTECGKCGCHSWHGGKGADSGSLVWLLGVVGGSIYYIQQAESFGAGVLGFLKALVWPAMLVYELLSFLGM